MDNIQKAIIMAASAFLFVMAVSIAIYSYNMVTETVESILTSSEKYSQNAEEFVVDEVDTERYANKAEIIMTIYNMEKNDFVPSKVTVNGTNQLIFNKAGGREEWEATLKTKDIEEASYYTSYTFSDYKVSGVVFTKINI